MTYKNSLVFTRWLNQFLLLNIFSFLSLRFLTYQLDSQVFWDLTLLSPSHVFWDLTLLSPSTLFANFKLLPLLFWILWMLVTMNKLKHMARHGPQALQVKMYVNICYGIFTAYPTKLAGYWSSKSNNQERHC